MARARAAMQESKEAAARPAAANFNVEMGQSGDERPEIDAGSNKRAREEEDDVCEVAVKMRRGPPRRPCLVPQTAMEIFLEPLSLLDFA